MIDLLSELKAKKIQIELPSHLWHNVTPKVLKIIQETKWKTFKFFEKEKHSAEIKKIDNKVGGIYVFYVSPEVIPQNHRIILYVGRARYTHSQNLRKRINEYYSYVPPDYRRPKIANMFQEWGDDVYCSYLELKCSNDIIDLIEKELINKLLPYCNDEIPDQKIRKAVKAAGLQ